MMVTNEATELGIWNLVGQRHRYIYNILRNAVGIASQQLQT